MVFLTHIRYGGLENGKESMCGDTPALFSRKLLLFGSWLSIFLVFRVDFLVATVFHSPTAPASERMKSESAPGFVTMTPLSNVQRYRPPWPAGWTE